MTERYQFTHEPDPLPDLSVLCRSTLLELRRKKLEALAIWDGIGRHEVADRYGRQVLLIDERLRLMGPAGRM